MAEAYEMHGVWASAGDTCQWIDIREIRLNKIQLSLENIYKVPAMSPVEARYLARKLYRLARKIEKRTEAAK